MSQRRQPHSKPSSQSLRAWFVDAPDPEGLGEDDVHLARVPREEVAMRDAIHRLLAAYLGRSPADVTIERTRAGKPFVQGIEHSLTHAGGLAIVAVARRSVGIDVERVDAALPIERLSQRVLDATERAALARSSDVVRSFLRAWTAKEAFVKATGEGLAGGLERVRVQLEGELAIAAIDGRAAVGVRVAAVDPDAEHVGAVVLVGPHAPT